MFTARRWIWNLRGLFDGSSRVRSQKTNPQTGIIWPLHLWTWDWLFQHHSRVLMSSQGLLMPTRFIERVDCCWSSYVMFMRFNLLTLSGLDERNGPGSWGSGESNSPSYNIRVRTHTLAHASTHRYTTQKYPEWNAEMSKDMFTDHHFISVLILLLYTVISVESCWQILCYDLCLPPYSKRTQT